MARSICWPVGETLHAPTSCLTLFRVQKPRHQSYSVQPVSDTGAENSGGLDRSGWLNTRCSECKERETEGEISRWAILRLFPVNGVVILDQYLHCRLLLKLSVNFFKNTAILRRVYRYLNAFRNNFNI